MRLHVAFASPFALPLVALPLVALALVALAACAKPPVSLTQEQQESALEGDCDAALVQAFIGETATQPVGAAILTQSRSRQFRWIPAGSRVTQDFRPARVNVHYDETRIINQIRCG